MACNPTEGRSHSIDPQGVAAATAALTWMAVEHFMRKRATLLGACSGAVAGLVAITPASGFVDVEGALGADDSLDVFGIHGVGGLVGALLTGAIGDRRS